jgi:hypothetical protein
MTDVRDIVRLGNAACDAIFLAFVILLVLTGAIVAVMRLFSKTEDRGPPSVQIAQDSTVADTTGFRIRLRARIAKGLTSEAASLNVMVMNKDVTMTSQNKKEPLNKAKWIVLEARGFSTEEAARRFGTRLRSILQLAALASRLGVDAGEDKPTAWVSEDFARAKGLIKDNERIAPNVHGLSILPDDDNTRFPVIDAQGTVTADPGHFVSALRELGGDAEISLGAASNVVRLLNFALMTSEPLAQMVLCFSAVEELGQNRKWSKSQKELIERLAVTAEETSEGTASERAEVADAIRKGLFPLGLLQGVKRLLSRFGLGSEWDEWDRLYRIRSGLFHGTARLSDDEIHQAARDTVTLCGRIILAIAAKEGVRTPTIAATHFGTATPETPKNG